MGFYDLTKQKRQSQKKNQKSITEKKMYSRIIQREDVKKTKR